MATNDTRIRHLWTEVSGVEIFYREAGDPETGTIVLLPGHPSGAHAYDGLTKRLAANWHVIAPDYPGYGFSAAPADAPWTFDWLAEITSGLLEQLGLNRYALYMFDFGAPVGFRIAVDQPDRVAGIVTQNGNIYTEGFGPGVAPLASWWEDRAKGQADVDGFLTTAGTRLQWEAGARDVSTIDPATWTLDQALLNQPALGLPDQPRALPRVSGLPARTPAAAGRGMGQERPVLHPAGGGGLQARRPGRRGRAARHRPLRPRRGDGRDCRPRRCASAAGLRLSDLSPPAPCVTGA
jgi:pimeloyl-ACP methyl ester carboxylesterase